MQYARFDPFSLTLCVPLGCDGQRVGIDLGDGAEFIVRLADACYI